MILHFRITITDNRKIYEACFVRAQKHPNLSSKLRFIFINFDSIVVTYSYTTPLPFSS